MHYKRYMSNNTNGSHNNNSSNNNNHINNSNNNNMYHRHVARTFSTTNSISTIAMCNTMITIQMKWLFCIILFVSFFINFILLLHFNSIGMISNYNYYTYDTNIQQHQQLQQFNEHNLAKQTENLIIVAGHSVTISDGHLYDANHDESDWYMLEYQKHHGLPEAIIGHIQTGIDSTSYDPKALLIFSGGQTRAMIGPKSEGSSYYHVADAMNLWSKPITTSNSRNQYIRTGSSNRNNQETDKFDPTRTVRARTITEEYATDSFQNLLFSICRFYEITGHYPNMITMISYTFKQHRFETLHLPALHWPNHKFHYIGYDPPSTSGFDLMEATKGEIESAAQPFEHDPYGCYSKILQNKRQERNPFIRTPPYDITCPDMVDLFHYCGIIYNKQIQHSNFTYRWTFLTGTSIHTKPQTFNDPKDKEAQLKAKEAAEQRHKQWKTKQVQKKRSTTLQSYDHLIKTNNDVIAKRDQPIISITTNNNNNNNNINYSMSMDEIIAASLPVYDDGYIIFRNMFQMPNSNHTANILRRLAYEFIPIIRQRKYNIISVSEFCCCGDGMDYQLGGKSLSVRPGERISGHESERVMGYNRCTLPNGTLLRNHTSYNGINTENYISSIHLRLRLPLNHHQFISYEQVCEHFCHELAHCIYHNHSKEFYTLMQDIQKQHETLMKKINS